MYAIFSLVILDGLSGSFFLPSLMRSLSVLLVLVGAGPVKHYFIVLDSWT